MGAVLVRPDNTVAGLGYNGFPRKMPDDPALYANRLEKYARIVHAEINAKDSCQDPSIVGYTMYTTMPPCDRCFVQIANRGVSQFVFIKPTPDQWSRWGAAFESVQIFATEMKIELRELEL